MITSRGQIEQWFREGYDQSYSYMIVACDQFDYGDYPVYAHETSVEHIVAELLERELTDVHEVYDLDMDMDDQINEKRAWHTPDGSPPPPKKGIGLTCGCELTEQMIQTAAENEHSAPVVVCPTHGVTVLTTQS